MASLAKLQVSKCGRLAILFNSTGEYFVVWSKPYGQYLVESGMNHAVITDEDAKMLLDQIAASPLPDSDALVGVEVQAALKNLNEAHASIPGYELEEEMITQAINFLEERNKPIIH